MSREFHEPEALLLADHGLFIANEGNFQYGNASLSFYNPADGSVTQDLFFRANDMKLGDVAQSLTLHGGRLWAVVNNSHVVFAINPSTGREVGRITNLTSPRYIHFVDNDKAYVTQLWDNRIFIVNPLTFTITGFIEIPGMSPSQGSTEQMVQIDDKVYCTCWSYNNSIIVIDTETDRVIDSIVVGVQPRSLVVDGHGMLWTITDGGYQESPTGHEPPTLCCINPAKMSITRRITLGDDAQAGDLAVGPDSLDLYWIADGVWHLDLSGEKSKPHEVIRPRNRFYALTVNPGTGDIYVADAIDYQQRGVIYRYSPDGLLVESFYAGINPGAFCWK